MDPSLLILTLSICFCFLAISVQSQQNVSPLSPPPSSPQPPPPRQQNHHHPLPPKPLLSAPKSTTSDSKDSNHNKNNDKKHHTLKKKPKWGKKLGFMFVGVAGILQVSKGKFSDDILPLSIIRNCIGFVLENIVLHLLCPVRKECCRETSILLMEALPVIVEAEI